MDGRKTRTRWAAPVVAQVVADLQAGLRPEAVATKHCVPVATVRTWARGRLPRAAARVLEGETQCPSCGGFHDGFRGIDGGAYSYLLALYLGDGYLSKLNGTQRLQLSLDTAYPGIVDAACTATSAVRGRSAHRWRTDRGFTAVTSYWNQWACHLPQHGTGKKHHRPIELTPWQWEIVRAHPEPFLRGLIHTDGWRGLNRVTVKGRRYEYPRYQFSNRSDDIRRLFCDACDLIGVEWRPWGRWHVSVARRDSVARLDEFIGPKR